MITPKDMKRFTDNRVVAMYDELNETLTREIIKKIEKLGDVSSFTRAQMRTLKQLGGKEVFKTALKKTSKLNKKQKKEVLDIFADIGATELKGYKNLFEAKGLAYEFSDGMLQILDQAINTSNRNLNNITGSTAYQTKRTYIKAVDKLYKQVATGAFDYGTALKATITELAEKGITLTTKNGRHEKIDVAAKRALFSSIQNTATAIAKEVGELIDANCVYIGHSTKCRPSHHPIDAVTMSLDVFKQYEDLPQEPNCNHIVNYDWQEKFEGVSGKIETHDDWQDYATTVKNYEMQQKANYFARQVRAKKEKITTEGENAKTKRQLLSAQKKYREFCKQNGLDVNYFQTWQAGYNKIGSRIWNSESELKKKAKKDIQKFNK